MARRSPLEILSLFLRDLRRRLNNGGLLLTTRTTSNRLYASRFWHSSTLARVGHTLCAAIIVVFFVRCVSVQSQMIVRFAANGIPRTTPLEPLQNMWTSQMIEFFHENRINTLRSYLPRYWIHPLNHLHFFTTAR